MNEKPEFLQETNFEVNKIELNENDKETANTETTTEQTDEK